MDPECGFVSNVLPSSHILLVAFSSVLGELSKIKRIPCRLRRGSSTNSAGQCLSWENATLVSVIPPGASRLSSKPDSESGIHIECHHANTFDSGNKQPEKVIPSPARIPEQSD
ncbi:hypothetical protein CCHR01_01261 [Colletotrichum chrysophilum]|uniref:Uncharacterized protein n=1 Tax=Colletotrichum chrysophilum TaxID=1836956 RepID=A0AAD9AY83_9PEZI|nr:hypothetical protein CCHR01_01261 [Colletotrichum chrysophilum]